MKPAPGGLGTAEATISYAYLVAATQNVSTRSRMSGTTDMAPIWACSRVSQACPRPDNASLDKARRL
jgi:hypothetical protein